MSWDLTNSEDLARLRVILLRAADATRVAGQSLDQALVAIASGCPQLPAGDQRGDDPDDDRDEEPLGYDDLSGLLANAITMLKAVRQPPAPVIFPTDTSTLRALIEKFDPEGRTL